MSDTLSASIAPGWYDDPAGSGLQRWWSGIGWTEHTHDPAPTPAQPSPSPADNFGYTGGYKPMSSTPGYDQVVVTPERRVGSASGNTFGVWAIALSLFWSFLIYLPASLIVSGLAIAGASPLATLGAFAGLYLGAYAVYDALLFFFAWRDRVALRSRGIAAPSPLWLLLGQIGYLIARRIVLKRDGVRSNAPGNVFAIPFLLAIVLAIVIAVVAASNPALVAGTGSPSAISTLQKQAATQLDAQAGGTWTVTCPAAAPTTSAGATFVCNATDTTGRSARLQATVTTPGRFVLTALAPVTPQQTS
jgi:hypothetical protein